jgi:hypothetical protein
MVDTLIRGLRADLAEVDFFKQTRQARKKQFPLNLILESKFNLEVMFMKITKTILKYIVTTF